MNLLVLKNECLHDCQHLNEVTSGQAVPNAHRYTDMPVMVQRYLGDCQQILSTQTHYRRHAVPQITY